jgi:uncharacterized protein YjcR
VWWFIGDQHIYDHNAPPQRPNPKRDQFLEMYRTGRYTQKALVEMLGISQRSASYWARQEGLAPRAGKSKVDTAKSKIRARKNEE